MDQLTQMNNTIEIIHQETYTDKSKWRRGEWDHEPDKIHFLDKKTQMDCLVVRGPSGALCGYVAVTEGHPAFNTDYNRVQVDCHGDLTYSGFCQEDGKICHVPREGQPDHVFWHGFDCNHSGDMAPSYPDPYFTGGTYKNLYYVIHECQSLAHQLSKREPIRELYDWEVE